MLISDWPLGASCRAADSNAGALDPRPHLPLPLQRDSLGRLYFYHYIIIIILLILSSCSLLGAWVGYIIIIIGIIIIIIN